MYSKNEDMEARDKQLRRTDICHKEGQGFHGIVKPRSGRVSSMHT
jgi:hypothetical protein